MANGYEPLKKRNGEDRIGALNAYIEEHIDDMKSRQDFLSTVDFEYSDSFKELLNSKNIPLQYLDQYNQPYV